MTVGQPVTVVVEVLVPNWFTGAPWFPSLDVADAIAIYEDRGGVNFTESIEGETWAGQSRSYDVYPQRPGRFEIAADSGPGALQARDQAAGAGRWFAATGALRGRLATRRRGSALFHQQRQSSSLEQSFDRPAGEAEGRRGFRSHGHGHVVEDALSMVVPPLPTVDVPGLASYPDPPVVRDEGGERGEPIRGRRVESTTFVAEREGRYRLEPIELVWWDVGADTLRTASLPAVDILVEANPDAAAEIALPEDEAAAEAPSKGTDRLSLRDLFRWLLLLAILVVAGRFGAGRLPELRRRLEAERRKREQSEAAYFERFRSAARSGDELATWNRWIAWLDRSHRGPETATVRGFVEAAGDDELQRLAGVLTARLFCDSATVDDGDQLSLPRLAQRVAAVRRRARLLRRHPSKTLDSNLNPGRPLSIER